MRFIIMIMFLYSVNTGYSQYWSKVGNGVKSGSQWGSGGHVFTMLEYNGKLIVGGQFEYASSVLSKNIAAWDGTSWSGLQNGITSSNSGGHPGMVFSIWNRGVHCLAVYNNELYAGGAFEDASGIPVRNIAKWDGNSWVPFIGTNEFKSGAMNNERTVIKDMLVYNNELYVTGYFDSIGGIPAANIAKYNGTSWSAVSSKFGSIINPISKVNGFSLCECNGKLILSGTFDSIADIKANNVASYNGTTWSSLGNGVPVNLSTSFNGGVRSVHCFNGEIYAGNNITGLSKWNGSTWSAAYGGLTNGTLDPMAMAYYNVSPTKMIVTGAFKSSGSLSDCRNISVLNNGTWENIHPPTFGYSGNTGTSVLSVVNFQGSLYFGGIFEHAPDSNMLGIINVSGITKLVNSNDVSVNKQEGMLKPLLYPNPSSGLLMLDMTDVHGKGEIILSNMLGQIVYNHQLKERLNTFDISKLPKGLYTYLVTIDNGISTKGKLAIE